MHRAQGALRTSAGGEGTFKTLDQPLGRGGGTHFGVNFSGPNIRVQYFIIIYYIIIYEINKNAINNTMIDPFPPHRGKKETNK